MGVQARITAKFVARQTGANDLGLPDFSPTLEAVVELMNGTGANQSDLIFADRRSFLASTADALDLAGVLVDAFGATLTFVELTAIFIKNLSTVTLSVGAGSTPWFGFLGSDEDVVKVFPGGCLLLVAPDAAGMGTITPSTADKLTITPGAAPGDYEIILIGRSA